MQPENKDEKNRPDCFKCAHFALTWERRTPRLCRLYGFKTASMPSVVFHQTTGSPCVGFKRKNPARG